MKNVGINVTLQGQHRLHTLGSTDTNTGLYKLKEDVVGLSTGGQERFRVVEDGKVGINLKGDPMS